MTPFAIMGIGISGAGKSTLLRSLAEWHDLPYISRDDLMEEVTGNPHEQRFREEIGKACDNLALMSIARRGGLVIDSTFVDREKRCRQIMGLRFTGADIVIGVHFDTPFEVASERNRTRTFAVKQSVLCRQYMQLSAALPSTDDGFDYVFASNELEKLEHTLWELFL